MIRYIKGKLAIKGDSYIVVETSGIGYMITVPLNSNFYLKEIGDEVLVYTSMAVREDDISLYGFDSINSLELFEMLITVNGVGSKAAIAIFSALPAEEIKKAIIFEDVAMLTRANGIGKKTAQRIVLDLKDKFDTISCGTGSDDSAISGQMNISVDAKTEALNALMELGYTRMEASQAIGKISDNDLSVEDYIKKALSNF